MQGFSLALPPATPTYKFYNLNLNAIADNAIVGLPAKWRLLKVTLFDVSTTLAVSLAVIGLFTATAGGGTNLLTSVVTGLTGATVSVDQTLANNGTYQTAGTIYLRPTTVHGSAATVSVFLQIQDLT